MGMLFSSPNVMMGAGLIVGAYLMAAEREESEWAYSTTVAGTEVTAYACAAACDPYEYANLGLEPKRPVE